MRTQWDTDDEYGEMWFPVESQDELRHLARTTAHVDGGVVEVGSWTGRSTVALANAVWPSTVHAVDTWKGSPGEVSAELAKERDVYRQFLNNVARHTKGNVQAHRQDWRDYFATHPGPIRFCFIDATHTYEEVRDNLVAVAPLMVPGGVLCGDDVHHEPVRRAVIEAFPTARCAATLWIHRVT